MTTPNPRRTNTAATRFPKLLTIVADRFGEIEQAIATVHPATDCLPLPDFTALRPTEYTDLERMRSVLGSNLYNQSRGVYNGTAQPWVDAMNTCTHTSKGAVQEVLELVRTWHQLLSALASEAKHPRTWRNHVNSMNETAIERVRVAVLHHIPVDVANDKAAADLAATDWNAPVQVKLTASENVLANDVQRGRRTDDVSTVVAACAAQAALSRGWEPNPADPHGMDTETAKMRAEIATGLAADPSPSLIVLGHSAVAWLNANKHVASGGTAVLDESGFYIEFGPLTPADSVLTSTYAGINPDLDPVTMVNCCVAEMGLARGWEPPIDAPDLDFLTGEQVADYVDQLDENGSEYGDEPIARVAEYVVEWLVACDYIAPGHLAFLDDDGFHIVPATSTDVLDALQASSYDPEQGYLDRQLVAITDRVTGVRDPHEDRPGHQAFQILFNSDEQTGGGISHTEEAGWQTWGPILAATGEIPRDRYPKNHPDFATAVTWMALTLTREFAKPMNMTQLHYFLTDLAARHGIDLNRIHAYIADYNACAVASGACEDLPAEVLAAVDPIKAEIRARRSPTTFTVPTDAVPDAGNPEAGEPALEAWVDAAKEAGFEVQGWGSHFPGIDCEDFDVVCGGVAIGYRWYALDVIGGKVMARDVETEAEHETIGPWDPPA